MTDLRNMSGTVYILENVKAQRVKIGMTINDVEARRRDANDKWLGFKATCQICGAKCLVSNDGNIPKHSSGSGSCLGSNEPPLEKSTSIAEIYLEELKQGINERSGSEKGSASRQIKNLEKRLILYRDYKQPVGIWEISTTYYTESAEQVELDSHKILSSYLDELAPFGEVFISSVDEASQAVESALRHLGLLEKARKQVQSNHVSEKYGACSICGGNLTERGTCPSCIERLWGE